jgi:hypothetical protein
MDAPNRKENRPRILPSTLPAKSEGVEIRLLRHGESDDVHRQYPHHRDAADDVERENSLAAHVGRYRRHESPLSSEEVL